MEFSLTADDRHPMKVTVDEALWTSALKDAMWDYQRYTEAYEVIARRADGTVEATLTFEWAE